MSTRTTAAPPPTANSPQHLLDFARLWAGIRRRRRLWVAFGLIGFLAGGMLAVLMPPPPSAVTRVLVVHEEDAPSDGGSLIRTDVTLMTTTRIAAAALKSLGLNERPEEFLKQYEVVGVTNNVLEVTVEAPTGAEAARRAKALAEAFIADHIGRIQAAADAEAGAITEQRAQVQKDLDGVNGEISGAEAAAAEEAQNNENEEGAPPQPNAAGLDSLYARRAELTDRITQLTQQAQEAGLGAPRVEAGTQIVDAPRPARASLKITGATNAGIGLVLGLVLGLTLAAVTGAVKDKPVLRRDIAENLGASVIAQLPPRRRGLARFLPDKKAAREHARVAATLVRLVRDGAGPVSMLELGAAKTAAVLTTTVAKELAADRPVAIVADPDLVAAPTETEHPVRVLDAADTTKPAPGEARLGIGTVGPGATWTDLPHLGTEALLVVRAGFVNTAWLHTIARQLADAGIPIVGVVLVDPDPRDKTDGTLWDGLHTALRGRARHAEQKTNGSNGSNNGGGKSTNGADLPTKRLTPVQPPAKTPAQIPPQTAAKTPVHDLPTKKFAPVRRETEELTQRRTQG